MRASLACNESLLAQHFQLGAPQAHRVSCTGKGSRSEVHCRAQHEAAIESACQIVLARILRISIGKTWCPGLYMYLTALMLAQKH